MLYLCGLFTFICAVSSLEAKTLNEKGAYDASLSQVEWKSNGKGLTSKNCGDFNGKSLEYDDQYGYDCENYFENSQTDADKELESLSKDYLFPVKNFNKVQDLNKLSKRNKTNFINKRPRRIKVRSLDENTSVSRNTKNHNEVESNGTLIDDGSTSSVVPGSDEAKNSSELIGHFSGQAILNTRSFIFNPSAQPQEQFQNCTTPKNESGRCRYLQHCMVPSIVSSFNQFMGYVCIIKGRFIGVCCPVLPANIVEVPNKESNKGINEQKTKENKKEQNQAKENATSECGIGTNTRIVGGLKADPKAWPWMVALLAKAKKRFFCGGALINNRYVLTAAHCTFGIRNNEIIARLGEYDFKEDHEVHADYTVSKIKRHGLYSTRTLRNDIALLELEKPVVFNEFIKTICLPEVEKSYVGDVATLAGWGNIKGTVLGDGKTSDVLQEASFPVMSNEECGKIHGIMMVDSLICTRSAPSDKGACNGDSGGPLMLLDENNRWKTIGLVSWGRRGCNPEYPTVYTRVSHFLEWINKHSRT